MKLDLICKYLVTLDKRIRNDFLFDYLGDQLVNKKINNLPTIGNLVLNKYLHIAQMIYLGKHGKKLFEEEVVCFLNGGVVFDAWKKWYEYRNFDSQEILKKIENKEKNLSQEEKFLIKFVEKFKKYPITSLIRISHFDPGWKECVPSIFKNKTENYINLKKYQKDYKEFFEDFWEKPAKPFIKWAGGKRNIMKYLLENIPKNFNDYYEPFLGGGALFYKIYDKAKEKYLSDINSELIVSYNVIKKNHNKLIQKLEIHKKNHNKTYYNEIRSKNNIIDYVEIAARFIYLNKTCFNGLYRVNKKGKFNSPIGSYKNPNILDINNLSMCNKVFQKTSIKVCQFYKIKPKKNDFVYFDPPYHRLDKNSFTSYTNNDFTEEDQILLRDFIFKLHKKKVKIMLSNSNTEFIKELYKSKIFNIIKIKAPRFINCKSNKRGFVEELLIRNYQ